MLKNNLVCRNHQWFGIQKQKVFFPILHCSDCFFLTICNIQRALCKSKSLLWKLAQLPRKSRHRTKKLDHLHWTRILWATQRKSFTRFARIFGDFILHSQCWKPWTSPRILLHCGFFSLPQNSRESSSEEKKKGKKLKRTNIPLYFRNYIKNRRVLANLSSKSPVWPFSACNSASIELRKVYAKIWQVLPSSRMPVQAPSWTEFLICPICTNEFAANLRAPITLRCGHSICKKCLANIQQCPYDQVSHVAAPPVVRSRHNFRCLGAHFHFRLLYFQLKSHFSYKHMKWKEKKRHNYIDISCSQPLVHLHSNSSFSSSVDDSKQFGQPADQLCFAPTDFDIYRQHKCRTTGNLAINRTITLNWRTRML